jgi:light-regulated signal transduction histidine kinase (bacteriophytochrome)
METHDKKAQDKEEEALRSTAFRNVSSIASARRRAEDELIRTKEALEAKTAELARANQELERFAAIAAHDLRQPLRNVARYIGMLAKRNQGRLDADSERYIASSLAGAQRMDELIRALLEYARMHDADIAREQVDLKDIVDVVVQTLEEPMREAGAVVRTSSLPTIRANRILMTQLLQNLIQNAIKFRGTEPPVVAVEGAERDDEWIVAVRDNGIGIPAEQRARIFEIFRRLHSNDDYPGLGIGLALARRIVERHGGRIWVESEPGRGSTFFFSLPKVAGK